jgi:hypothetical protein
MHQTKKIIVLVMLSLACFAAAGGVLDKSIGFFGMRHVGNANDAYMQEAFDRSLAGFLVLSGIKSGLAVIEGSEVGIDLFCDPVCADQKSGNLFDQIR